MHQLRAVEWAINISEILNYLIKCIKNTYHIELLQSPEDGAEFGLRETLDLGHIQQWGLESSLENRQRRLIVYKKDLYK